VATFNRQPQLVTFPPGVARVEASLKLGGANAKPRVGAIKLELEPKGNANAFKGHIHPTTLVRVAFGTNI
jgi:hypothetical protein